MLKHRRIGSVLFVLSSGFAALSWFKFNPRYARKPAMPFTNTPINRVNDASPNARRRADGNVGALSAAIEDAYAYTQNEQAIFGEPVCRTNSVAEQSHRPARRTRRSRRYHSNRRIRTRVKRLGIMAKPSKTSTGSGPTQSQFDPHPNFRPPVDYPSGTKPSALPSTYARSRPRFLAPGQPPTTRLCLKWLDTHPKTAKASSTTAAVRISWPSLPQPRRRFSNT